MTMTQGKRVLAFVCVIISLFASTFMHKGLAESSDALGIHIQLKAQFDPYALEEKPTRFLIGLEQALEKLDFNGQAVLQNEQANIQGDFLYNGLTAIDFRLAGWADWLGLTTNLFGEKPVLLTMANYMPFLMKMYDYFQIPVQYIGIFSDSYSYQYAFMPQITKWKELTGGMQSRSYSKEETINIATQMADSLQGNNRAFYHWVRGLLYYVGLDELVNEFTYALPEWAAYQAKDGGLNIQVTDQGENWILGDHTVYTLSSKNGILEWVINIPEWEGYRLTAQFSLETKDTGMSLKLNVNLYEDDELYAYLNFSGLDLPDGRLLQGKGRLELAYGGEGIGLWQEHIIGLEWDQSHEGEKDVLRGEISYLHPETQKKILAVNGTISFGETEDSIEMKSRDELQGIDFFCMNDVTIDEFFADAKWPMVRAAMPMLIELPPALLDGLIDWIDANGILLTLVESMGN